MNPDQLVDTTEKTANAVSKFMKWIMILASSFLLLTSAFWAIFYSPYLANLGPVIQARLFYQGMYYQVEGIFVAKNTVYPYPHYKPVYTINVLPPVRYEGTHLYLISGTFAGLNPEKGTISLKGADGKIYVFAVGSDWGKLDNGTIVPFPSSNQAMNKQFDKSQIDVDNNPYLPASNIQIMWTDTRSLAQMLKDYKNDPFTPINLYYSKRLFWLVKLS